MLEKTINQGTGTKRALGTLPHPAPSSCLSLPGARTASVLFSHLSITEIHSHEIPCPRLPYPPPTRRVPFCVVPYHLSPPNPQPSALPQPGHLPFSCEPAIRLSLDLSRRSYQQSVSSHPADLPYSASLGPAICGNFSGVSSCLDLPWPRLFWKPLSSLIHK